MDRAQWGGAPHPGTSPGYVDCLDKAQGYVGRPLIDKAYELPFGQQPVAIGK